MRRACIVIFVEGRIKTDIVLEMDRNHEAGRPENNDDFQGEGDKRGFLRVLMIILPAWDNQVFVFELELSQRQAGSALFTRQYVN